MNSLSILKLHLGALSDSSPSKYRRRYWIILSTAALVISTLTLAYCQELASIMVDLLGVGAGDWDEKRNKRVSCMIYPTDRHFSKYGRLQALPLDLL